MNEKAPAKLNLGLRVGELLPEGLHRLKSLICPLGLSDVLELELTPLIQSDRSAVDIDASLAPDLECHLDATASGSAERFLAALHSPQNLVVKAAQSFLDTAASGRYRILIRLEKHIPPEAGLGGGSSDAAAVLRMLASSFGIPVDSPKLLHCAESVGSDITALLFQHAVRVGGTGGEVTPLQPAELDALEGLLEGVSVLLVKPPFGCATGEMYCELDKLRADDERDDMAVGRPVSHPGWPSISRDGNDLGFDDAPLTLWPEECNAEGLSDRGSTAQLRSRLWRSFLFNDFEAVYFSRFPAMTRVKERLLETGAEHVFLAGSGSTLAALFPSNSTSTGHESVGCREEGEGSGSSKVLLNGELADLAGSGYFLRWTSFCPKDLRSSLGK